jgi:hypothetical protein
MSLRTEKRMKIAFFVHQQHTLAIFEGKDVEQRNGPHRPSMTKNDILTQRNSTIALIKEGRYALSARCGGRLGADARVRHD